MKAPVESRRAASRHRLARELMTNTGHHGHPHELEVITNELESSDHDRLVVVWCTSDTCKTRSPRGTAVGPTRVCLLDRCTLCHPVTWWEKVFARIRKVFARIRKTLG